MTAGAENDGRGTIRMLRDGTLAAAGVVVFLWFVKTAHVVTVPVITSFFLAVLVRPVQRGLQRRLHPRLRWLSLLLAVLLIVAVVGLLIGSVWVSVRIVRNNAPPYKAAATAYWNSISTWMRQHDLPLRDNIDSLAGFAERAVGFVSRAVASVWSVVAMLLMIFFLTIFLLFEWDQWRRKVEAAVSGEDRPAALTAVDTISRRVRGYLIVRIAVSLISGVSAGLFLWAVGVDFAFAWGVFTFALNFVPYIGSVISAVGPAILALIQFGPLRALVVLGGFAVIEQVVGGFLEPRLQGRAMKVSPFVLLASMIFWAWMWGIIGAVLAVPITVTFVVACSQIDSLRPLAALLGSEEELNRKKRADT